MRAYVRRVRGKLAAIGTDPEGGERHAVSDGVGVLQDPVPAERGEDGVIEGGSPIEVGDLDGEVVDHRPMMPAAGTAPTLP